MAYDRFLIAPLNTGYETDLRPWLIPDDAYALLVNMYVFRGRLRKRYGSRLMGSGAGSQAQLKSRLSINIGTTDGSGNFSATVPGAVFKVGQLFSIGTEILTVSVTGTPGVLLTTDASATHTYNTTTGALVITGAAAATIVYFYPAEPVTGLTQYQSGAINNQPSYGFDTQFAYAFDSALGRWVRSQSGGNPVFHGTSSQLFWAYNWRGVTPSNKALFVTNFNATVPTPGANDDPMWWFDGTTWTNFSTSTIFLTDGSYVQTARVIIGFKNRLLLLNTIERSAGGVNSSYVNRCRYSFNGNPFAANAWLQPKNTNGGLSAAGAGFIDAPTEEAIIGAEFIKDQLIVFFERSTWSLVYTGNQVLPFVWQKINTELGSQSTMSVVPFDKAVLAIGNTGVHACNGANVERIDIKIPDLVFRIFDKATGVSRVVGIRDYFTELVYWSFPEDSQASTQPFPTRVLIYNYKNNSWAVNDDTITAFGYFEQQLASTWATTFQTWEQSINQWNSGSTQAQFRDIIAGNQEGFVYIIDPDVTRNAPSRQISRMQQVATTMVLTITDHMFSVGDFIAVENCQGVTGIPTICYISAITQNTVTISNLTFTGVYTGGGTAAFVSNIVVYSKQWNPYVNQDRNVYVAKIDFGLLRTATGQITVDYFLSSADFSMVDDAAATNTLVGTNILETSAYPSVPLESRQNRVWHPIYFQGDGECIQLFITMSAEQMADSAIAWSDIQIEGMVLYTMPTSSRLQ